MTALPSTICSFVTALGLTVIANFIKSEPLISLRLTLPAIFLSAFQIFAFRNAISYLYCSYYGISVQVSKNYKLYYVGYLFTNVHISLIVPLACDYSILSKELCSVQFSIIMLILPIALCWPNNVVRLLT